MNFGARLRGARTKWRYIYFSSPTEYVLNRRGHSAAVRLAFCFTPALVVLSFLGCQSSIEKARIEMDPGYRSAKLLREQLKAGVTLAEFNRLRANFAAELGIISDRMRAKRGTERLLQPYFAAYSSALDAYSLVGAVWEARSAMDACTGPDPDPDYASAHSRELRSRMSLEEKIDRTKAESVWIVRFTKCLVEGEDRREALDQRSKELNTGCPKDVYSHLDCAIENAEGKLTAADRLLMQR